jgi:hypothetical protein
MSEKYATTTIMGGLGNKLFQIAHLLGYCNKYGYTPYIDDKLININNQTTVDWSYFIRGIDKREIDSVKVPDPHECYGTYFDEPNFGRNVAFHGYYQTEKYFKKITGKILVQFGCPDEKRDEFLKKYPGISNSYFLHVRRGDYVGNPHHFINLSNYYNKCLAAISPELNSGTPLFVFSDDIPYCREMFKNININITFIEDNEINSLWIMSLCGKGGICANSTFSWWGGWLNENSDKKVFFPSRFFPYKPVSTSDLVPSSFTIVDI